MNEINKNQFVERELRPLIRALDIGVIDVTYAREPHGERIGDEYVTCTFYNDYKRKICVTGDSLLALSRDVLRVLN